MKRTSSSKLAHIKGNRNKHLLSDSETFVKEFKKDPHNEAIYLPCIGHQSLSALMHKAKDEKVIIIYATEEWPII